MLVAAAYFVGANIGFILRLPPTTPSVVWPPNSILTATLLLAPRRRWWIYLIAAFPVHLAVALPTLGSLPLVLALYATNCSEALIAAFCVRRFSDAPARLDTLRRVGIYIAGAALAAPFLSSFPDAAAVAIFKGEPYWSVFATRFLSNVLTELTVAPAILTVVSAFRDPEATTLRGRRRAEAILLAVLLVAAEILAFTVRGPVSIVAGDPPRLPLAWLLPFLLWAAVRFAPVGSSLALLTTTLVAIWAASQARGPFSAPPLEANIVPLQLFLSVLAIPLMCLAALIEERRRVENALAERLRFEEFFSRLSAAFVHLPSQEIDAVITASLRNLGEFLQLDRAVLLRFPPGNGSQVVSHAWAAPGFEAHPLIVASRDCPAAAERLQNEEPFLFSRSADLGLLPGADVRSCVALPLVASRRVLGGLSLDSISAERTWPKELLQRLQVFAEVFANALARKEAEEALRASEVMKSAILASLTSGVAVLDREGTVIAVNESWTRRTPDSRAMGYAGAEVGADYLELCREAVRQGTLHAAEMLSGTREVLDGSRLTFSFEYPPPAAKAERWFSVSVVPLNRPEGGAVVSHTDVTERKRAEVQAQRSRQELAHFARVSTMGELTASLAHELSQPLTGIMTNAQAARKFLDFSPPWLGDLRAALEDIIDDNRRAADVIQRLRDLLRKGELRQARLDLNHLIGNMARLLGSDAIIRGTTMTLELDASPVLVNGDRVQLEQVILNLLINAMDAMGEVAEIERTIVVRTENTAANGVHVAIQDAGTGLREGTKDRIFEPFYTTKAAGMGMGLSIARSIIEAHGGSIWATNNQTRGATFHFALPQAGGAPA
ncbi:MAG TPA: MASE1 domain-containing protein [Myxococcales bacterium]|nr:MASE1 domain-containing protein [Myxococcales bacterium]